MSKQTQNQPQKQGSQPVRTTRTREFNTVDFLENEESDDDREVVAEYSFAASHLLYSKKTDVNPNVCKVPTKQKCTLFITNQCSNDFALIGGKCSKHNKSYFCKQYVMMPKNMTQSSIYPVSEKKCEAEKKFPLISLMNLNSKPKEIEEELIASCGNDCNDYESVAYFLSILSSSENRIVQDANFNTFKDYMLKLVAGYDSFIEKYSEDLKSIFINLTIGKRKFNKLKSNKWFQDQIYDTPPQDSNQCYNLYIPIIKFCIIDIIHILGYKLEISTNTEVYLPSCGIIDGYFVHGVSFGVSHAIDSFGKTTLTETYDESIRESIQKDQLKKTANLDQLSLLCIREANSFCTYSNLIEVAVFPNENLHIDKSFKINKVCFEQY